MLADYLAKKNYEPFNNDSFLVDFEANLVTNTSAELAVTYNNGNKTAFEYGKDFFIAFSEGSFEYELSPDMDNWIIRGRVTDTYELEKLIKENNIIFTEEQSYKNSYGTPGFSRGYAHVQISSDTYKKLTDKSVQTINISNNVDMEYKKASNVAGRIRGKDSSKCVVLTAHFDHVGSAGQSIFSGARDNASGVACLMLVADKLMEISLRKIFEADIIVAFTNGEEMQFLGSRSLAPVLKAEYEHLYNINIDSLGAAADEVFYMDLPEDGSKSLLSVMRAFMNDNNVPFNNESIGGDHIAFEENGISAVSITSHNALEYERYHRTNDTIDGLDLSQIIRISNLVTDFVLKNNDAVFTFETKIENEESDIEYPVIQDPSDVVKKKYHDLINDAVKGVDNGVDEEINNYFDDNGMRPLYTYKEYLLTKPKIENIKYIGGYRLELITTIYPTAYIYFADTSENEQKNALGIYVHKYKRIADNDYPHSSFIPIEDMDGYYLVKPNVILQYYTGFVYETERGYIEVDIGNFVIYDEPIYPNVIYDIDINTAEQVKEHIRHIEIDKVAEWARQNLT